MISSKAKTHQTQVNTWQYQQINLENKPFYLFFKRVFDITLSSMGLVMLSPLILIVIVLIKLEDSKGPIFFSQTRVGKNEHTFKMYKFRSMVSNAEDLLEQLMEQNEVQGAMFKMAKDPRVTKIGRFIRKTSIDELPQLINVLKGEMSLIGPRPPLLNEVAVYTSYQKQRLLVTPGCSGLWQISGRNEIGFEEMVELDLEYIKKRNIMLDIKITIKTISGMIFSKGAY